MRIIRITAVTLALAALSCTNLDVPDYYAGSIDSLTGGNATPTTVMTAAQGLAIVLRDVMVGSGYGGFVNSFGEIGREGYTLDPANPPNQTRRLVIEDNSLGSSIWTSAYAALRQGSVVLKAIDGLNGVTKEDKEAVRGWTKTMMALDLLIVADVFDASGGIIDVDRAAGDPPAPIVSKAEVFARINTLLDEAKVHLQASGGAFPFRAMSPGFAPFKAPADFLKFNRAIKARVDVYNRNWAAALVDLQASFIDPAGPLSFGAYNSYSTNSGDLSNPLYDPVPRTQVAHQSTISDAQLRADGTPDLRATGKTAPIATRVTNTITVDHKWLIYNSPSDPVPIIKNEELILLRAEANFQLGNRAAALADINIVRTRSGGLEPLTADPGDPGMLNEILYNRRYSLLWEGAHRWIDARRYNRLAQLPKYAPTHVVFPYAPIPGNECLPRNPQPAGCSIPTPF